MPNQVVILPVVSSNGTAVEPDAVVEIRVDWALNLPARCIVRIANVDLGSPPGILQPGAAVKVESGPGADVLFEGVTVAAEVESLGEPRPTLLVTAIDKSWKLGATTTAFTFANMTPAAIIAKLAQNCGLSAQTGSLPGEYEYLLQAGSDLDVLELIASRAGADWWCEGSDLHVKKLTLSAPVSEVPVQFVNLERFRVRASSMHPGTVTVVGWDPNQEEQVTADGSYAQAMAGSDAPFVTGFVGTGTHTHRYASMPVLTTDEARSLATSLMEARVASAMRVEGEGRGLTALKPGSALKVENAPPMLGGKYLVTSVEHRYIAGEGIMTRFVGGDRRPAGVVDVLGRNGHRIDLHGGVLVGQVTNNNDPNSSGRAKVRFLGLDQQQESTWARILTPGGGNSRGAVTVPEVNDEVLVGFEGGDLRKPVILGGLYGSTNAIPDWQVSNGKVLGRRTTSRLGHFLEFGDGEAPDKQHILLSLAGNTTKFRLGKDRIDLECPAQVPMAIKIGDQSQITFDGNGAITVKGTNVTVTAQQALKLEGMTVEIKAQTSLKLQAATLEAQGSGTAKVAGGGMLELSGGLVKIN